jgi:putative ABC transport system ATP-binding protein
MNEVTPKRTAPVPLIQVSRLSKSYHNGHHQIPVLREVSFLVDRGEMVAVMGPSGSGKSTLLYILGLLLRPGGGTYYLGGEDVLSLDSAAQASCRRQRLGFVFQTCDLLENSLVCENLEFPLIYAGVKPQERVARIAAALKKVNLEHRLSHYANRLSGGEQQRVAVARALVNRPQVILADEPTGQLDRANAHLIMDHFQEIVSGGDTAIIVVTHNLEVTGRCSRTFFLRDGVLYE